MGKPAKPACDPVGVLEVADRLGVAKKLVNQWRFHDHFPEPRWTVSGRPAWDWPDVVEWADATGRLPEPRSLSTGPSNAEIKRDKP